MLHECFTLLGRGCGSVTRGARGVQIVRHPAKPNATLGQQVLEALRELHRARLKVGSEVWADEVWLQVHHHRRLDLAPVDAMQLLVSGHNAPGKAKAKPAEHHHQHAMPHAQLPRYDVHYLRLPAMAVEDYHLTNAGAVDRLADVQPQTGERLGAERQRAWEGGVLVRFPYWLHWQHRERQRRVRQLKRALQDPLVNVHVHGAWQMRTMLLNGRHRQDGNRIHPGIFHHAKILRGHLVPYPERQLLPVSICHVVACR
mmetsp:Transcript_19005/g.47817  ORF Transcript_19005/g.47817 Transcript_19005/m.47817 type:complete len:257 (+) Transcript_19005:352-1122(+)